jgi:S1-C subfamily serine protease
MDRSMYSAIANSTFRVTAGRSSGSGFSANSVNTVITNHHVIEQALASNDEIYVHTEQGFKARATVVGYSDKSENDYAILEVIDALPSDRQFLTLSSHSENYRGMEIVFCGFPHGIHDLLIHKAIVSGPFSNKGFYVDGSVNGGNSGGPIISTESGEVVGIVTQRRFLGGAGLENLKAKTSELRRYCGRMAGTVVIMGVNFKEFATMAADGFEAVCSALDQNANSGIGIGFDISFAAAALSAKSDSHSEAIQPLQSSSPTETGPTENSPSRNSPCKCLSGLRYKHCCGKSS